VLKRYLYIDRLGDDTGLQYLSFSTCKATTVAHDLGEVSAGLTATRDGKTILVWNRVDRSFNQWVAGSSPARLKSITG
jgi:hypothetical protein